MITGESTADTSILLDRARAGDPQAFAALYREHFPSVRGTAFRMVRDQHEADDLAQEAFYMVFRAIKAGRGPQDSFSGYVLSTVRRLAYRHTTQKRQVWLSDDLGCFEPQHTAATGSKMLDDAAVALAGLPERWRHILWMIEVEKYAPAEIADQLGMTATAVSSLASRARDALRTAFLAQQVSGGGACTSHTRQLAAYARGTLANRWLRSLAKHVEGCPTCQRRLAMLSEQAARIGLASARPLAPTR